MLQISSFLVDHVAEHQCEEFAKSLGAKALFGVFITFSD
jgi:hypothetical protein